MTAPGWYPDPQNPNIVRWWDGDAWSPHTQPALPAKGTSDAVAVDQLGRVRADLESRIGVLRAELQAIEEATEIQSFGFYRPRYNFGSAAEYEQRLAWIRDQQKMLLQSERAWHCDAQWKVDGSAAAGRRMVKQAAKLMLRAFNGECDAAIAKARYDNVVKLDERMRKSFDAINKMGEPNKICITPEYGQLKSDELAVVHEHREKVQEEKEEAKRIREEMREEERAREEIERAQADAEKDEARNQAALDKARAQLVEATGKQHEKLEGLIARLETELSEALDRKAKAIARAQLTKSGHVYILSNVGSFGEGIFKIGLTRRLDPYDRVDELGDASVPFRFDVHAIIFSEDAPRLEHALHGEFASRRVNMVNARKEYFRASMDEIRAAVQKHHGLASFVLEAEAEEWRKTNALKESSS